MTPKVARAMETITIVPAVSLVSRKQTLAPGRRQVVGDGTNGRFNDVKQGDPGRTGWRSCAVTSVKPSTRVRRASRLEVRGRIRAKKSGNSEGAKAAREMDA